ncbi:filamentous hemagglutinin family N-terminal domain-containing protein [Roseateles sp. YR242]|uniref:hemagglutinin repeat-containing protein n=1 Tax=Roseateles sp. YR242 TaxID=1855305 RepID=UPI0008D7775F|nr:hemagglutinin repeat-containing protein [Roseateles sp. YR242]SEL22520.1 filamentous hemagglutinin family N-terminal domain-containing protein [Roseateles sp. YR242]
MLATIAMLIWAVHPGAIRAQVKADTTAPGHQQPTVLTTANGKPVVNIQTPSAAGVSHNRYSQMDVSGQGLILNNSRAAAQTQLGGAVAGNPWLTRGEARVILNEVHSLQPTRLNGFVEVAGRTADVIIANPTGLQIDGGGFLNANRVTLTTGRPHWGEDGSVQGFDVQGGRVQVDGLGLDASQADYTAILTRALTLNAGVWAKALEVQTGASMPGATSPPSQGSTPPSTSPSTSTWPESAPLHALDSTALGGLYAQRIRLVASEQGLGVRHHGRMMADQLSLDIHGQLHNAGSLQALATTDDALVVRAGELRNEGWIAAGGSVTLQADRLTGTAGSVTAAGWQASNGQLAPPGGAALRLQAQAGQQQAGQLLSSGSLSASGTQLDLNQAQAFAQQIDLKAARVNAEGAVMAAADLLQVQASEALNSPLSRLSAQQLDLQSPRIDGRGAEWLHLGPAPQALAATEVLTIDGARIGSNAASLSLSAPALNADGARVEHHEGQTLAVVADQLSARGSQWSANGRLTLEAREADLARAHLQGAQLALQTAGLRADGATLLSGADLRIQADTLRQEGGTLQAQDNIVLQVSDTAALAGSQLAARGWQVSAGALDLTTVAAKVQERTDLQIRNMLRSDAAALGTGELLVSAGSWSHVGGGLWVDRAAAVRTQVLDNRDGLLQAGQWTVKADQLLNTGNGQVHAAGAMGLQVDELQQNGALIAGDRLAVEAKNWRNTGTVLGGADVQLLAHQLEHHGTVLAGGDLQVQTTSLQSTGAFAAGWEEAQPHARGSGGSLHLVSTGTLSHTGLLMADGQVSVQAPSMDLRGSQMATDSLTLLASQGALLLDNARLEVGQVFQLDAAGQASLRGAITQAGEAHWGADHIDHRGASLSTKGDVSMHSQSLLNADGGRVRAGGTAVVGVERLDNNQGALVADGGLTIHAREDVTNQGGTLMAAGAVHLETGRNIDNTAGLIASSAADVNARAGADVSNHGGSMVAADRITLSALLLDNTSGEVAASAVQLSLKDTNGESGVLNNRDGRLLADEWLSLNAGALDNTGGQVLSAGDLQLTLAGDHTHRQGDQLASAGAAALTTTGRFINEGQLHGGQSLDITAREVELLAGSALSANELAVSTTGTLINRGTVDGGAVRVDAGELLNLGTGQLFGDELSIKAGQMLNGEEGGHSPVVAARETLAMDVAGELVNRQGALLLSEGRMDLNAGSLRNENANIESAGDMRLSLQDRLDNLSIHAGADAAMADGESPRVLESLASISSGGSMAITAQTVVNSGGTLDVRGDLDLQAASLHNLNPYLQWALTETSTRDTHFELPDGKGTYRPDEVRVLWKVGEIPEGWYSPWGSQAQDSLEPFVYEFTPAQSGWSQDTYNRKLLLPSAQYPNEIFNRYLGGDGGELGGSADRAFVWLRSADYVKEVCGGECNVVLMKGQHYAHDDRIWSDFGVTPGNDTALDDAMAAFYEDANQRLVGGFSFVDVTTTKQQARVTQSAAGRIVVGGQLSIRGGELVNQMSQVVGRDGVDIQADQLRNEGVLVQLQDREEGDRYRTYNLGSSVPNTGIDHAKVHAVTAHTVSLALPTLAQAAGSRPALGGRPAGGPADAADGAQGALNRLEQAWEAGSGSAGPGGGAGSWPSMGVGDGGLPGGLPSGLPSGGAGGPPSALPLPGLGGIGSGNGSLQAVPVDLRLPTNSLHAVRPEATASFLIETDPRFVGQRSQLSSDFLLNALALEIESAQKRLGDGAYEQRLVREQLRRLTGSQYLDGFDSDEAMYRALMTEGASFASQHQLQPGVALSADQMALLTSDLVWLVEQTVTLADGSQQRVLVPQVYVVPRPEDVSAEGALIAGDRIRIALGGELLNQGSIHAGGALQVQAKSATHSGSLRAASLALTTEEDLRVQGGAISSTGDLRLQAGGDLALRSTAGHADTAQSHRTVLDRLTRLDAGGNMVLTAGRDLTLTAAELRQTGQDGGMALQAGRDLALESLRATSSDQWIFNKDNHQAQRSAADMGSQLQAKGALQASAGQDLSGRAAVIVGDGAVQLSAARDVRLEAGTAEVSSDSQWKTTRRGFLSSTTERSQSSAAQTWAIPSSVSGGTTSVSAGRDLSVIASEVVADGALRLAAGRDVALTSVMDSEKRSEARSVDRSGLMGAQSGWGFSVGRQSASGAQVSEWQSVAGTTVGSVAGDVAIVAGGDYRQSGSTVAAQRGDIDITAAQVNIGSVTATSTQSRSQSSRQSGLAISIGSPVFDAVSSLARSVGSAGSGADLKSKVMGVATVAGRVVQAPAALSEQLVSGGGLSLGASLGSSRTSSEDRWQTEAAQASRVEAGGDVRIKAQGNGADSTIRIQGSDVSAGRLVSLAAEGAIDLSSAQDRTSSRNDHHSSGASVGASAGLGTNGISAGWTAQASTAVSHSSSASVTQRNTHIEGSSVEIRTGADASLRGAVVAGETVRMDVAGQLLVESLQDSNRFDSQSHQASVSLGANKLAGSAGKSSARGEQAAVREQSGVRAGNGGFQVTVGGQAVLQGGVITSTEAAVQDGQNSLQAGGGLVLSDVHNHSSHKSQALSAAGGQSTSAQGRQTTNGSAGVAGHSGGVHSVTQAAVSGQAGNSSARTGDQAPDGFAMLDMAAEQQRAQAQSQRLQEFGSMASQVIGDYAAGKMAQAQDLRAQADKEPNTARRDALAQQALRLERDWGDEGNLRLAAHTAVGGLSGGVSGALSAAAGTWIAPRVDALLTQAGVDPTLTQVLTALASSAAGAMVGGGSGASVAFNEVTGNYLTHKELLKLRERLNDCLTEACKKEAQAEAIQRSQLRNIAVEDACLDGGSELCRAQLAKVKEHLAELQANPDGLGQMRFQPETANHIGQAQEKYKIGLQLLAYEAAEALGRTYISPDELARMGLLTAQEAKDLQDFRAGTGADVLGALAMLDGAGARPNRPMAPGATAAKIEAQRKLIHEQRVQNNADRDGGAEPHSSHPNTESTLALRDKIEIDQANGTSNPHYSDKHGPYVTLAQQYERAMTGTNPQTGRKGAPVNASKFFNATDMEVAIREAEAIYAANPLKYANEDIRIVFARPVGEGYTGNTKRNRETDVPIGEYRWTQSVSVRIDPKTGKAFTAFPDMTTGVAMPDPLKRGQDVH